MADEDSDSLCSWRESVVPSRQKRQKRRVSSRCACCFLMRLNRGLSRNYWFLPHRWNTGRPETSKNPLERNPSQIENRRAPIPNCHARCPRLLNGIIVVIIFRIDAKIGIIAYLVPVANPSHSSLFTARAVRNKPTLRVFCMFGNDIDNAVGGICSPQGAARAANYLSIYKLILYATEISYPAICVLLVAG